MTPQDPQPRTTLRRESDRVVVAAAAQAVAPAGRSRARLAMIGCVLGFALFTAMQLVSCQRTLDLDARDYADCREDNLAVAYQRVVAQDVPELARRRPRPARVLPILFCRRTVEVGRPIRLTVREERRYLAVYRRERLPRVDDDSGKVIGSDPLPPRARP